ncbi:hypothetical protein MKX01_031135 [Papaver californicum]|nr:hypothetical protein MKX01_031135 [Papaver californicum]
MSSNGIIGGFWPSWYAEERPPSSIHNKPFHYTHVFYAFLNPNPAANFRLEITLEHDKLMKEFTHHLHSGSSTVKAFLAIGGATDEGPENSAFAAMACNQNNRTSFIQSTIEEARRYGFDGVNLGWEFPYGEDGMNYLASVYKELRLAVDKEALRTGRTKLGISASVFFAPNLRLMSSRCRVYPAEAIASNVDFVNVMCYDYAGHWNTSCTGSIAALNNIKGGKYCTSYGIKEWINAGVPPVKLVMELPLYGRTWKLKDPNDNGIGAPVVGVGPQDDEYTIGYKLYHNVVIFNDKYKAKKVYDDKTGSCYSYSGTDWISYDGVKSIQAKVKHAKEKSLGGYFFFPIGEDNPNELSTAD